MINKVKTWLGIEGVKLELLLPEYVHLEDGEGLIRGQVKFTSMHAQTVELVRIILIEKYTRGRGDSMKIDEYELGDIELSKPLAIAAKEEKIVRFKLPFKVVGSSVDALGDKNIFAKGLASILRFAEGVKSEYRIEAEAKVKGVALNPFDKKTVEIK